MYLYLEPHGHWLNIIPFIVEILIRFVRFPFENYKLVDKTFDD